jgi:hypothetical protein
MSIIAALPFRIDTDCFCMVCNCLPGCGNTQLNKELATISDTDATLAQKIKMLNREITLELQYNADVSVKLKQRNAMQASRDSLEKRKAAILKLLKND